MKDDLRGVDGTKETPPPRVWGAEEYNQPQWKKDMARRGERVSKFVGSVAWAASWPLRFLWALASYPYKAYLIADADSRGAIRAVVMALSCLWFWVYVDANVLGLFSAFHWWSIPVGITQVVASIYLVVATVVYDPHVARCSECHRDMKKSGD